MQRLFSLLLLGSIIFSFHSCSGDEDEITGTYEITSFATTQCDDPSENFTFDFSSNGGCDDLFGVEVCGQGTITLSEDDTFTMSITISVDGDSDTLTSVGTYSIDGNQITTCEDNICETATFESGSGMIRMSLPDGSCIISITGKK